MGVFNESINNSSTISLIIFNILVYIVLSLSLFFILLILSDKTYSTLNKFKSLQEFHAIFIITIFSLLSLAGIPPLLGFVGKFLLYMQLLATKSFYLFIIFLTFNVFILYFYIQNVRFMVNKNTNKIRSTHSFYNLNYEFVFVFLIFILFFNIFGIFYFENFLNYLTFWVSSELVY